MSRGREAARLAARSFADDPFYQWLEPDASRRERLLVAIMLRALATATVRTVPEVAATGDDAPPLGLIAWHAPDVRASGGGLAVGLVRLLRRPLRAWRALWFLRTLRKLRPRTPHVHVELLAVDARARGQGLARRLLEPLLEQASQAGLVIHLETTNPDNLPLYQRFGFTEVARIHGVPGRTPTAWAMQRSPGVGLAPHAREASFTA